MLVYWIILALFPAAPELNILFVGNSLTYENDLPSLVTEIAAMDGIEIKATTIALPDYSLDDHWAEGTIQRALATNKYNYLIAQQGPSALPESQALLRESSIKISSMCRSHNTVFGLYMVWPSLARDFDREACITSYTNAAKASGALLGPAGLAWMFAWKKDPKMPLYGPDKFHPSIHGSVLAAMVIYASIVKKKDLEFIKSWKGISDVQLAILKTAAIEAINVL